MLDFMNNPKLEHEQYATSAEAMSLLAKEVNLLLKRKIVVIKVIFRSVALEVWQKKPKTNSLTSSMHSNAWNVF